MKDSSKTKQELIEELSVLKKKNKELEHSESERKRAEDALQASSELFSLFIRHSPIYTYIKEVTPTQSLVLQASDNFGQMIGIPGSEMAGKTMTELFPPELAAKITGDDWAVVSGGDVLRLNEELNGRSYTTIKFPIVQGDKTLLAGYTIDITDRKRAEDKLRESEQRYRLLIETASEGIFVAQGTSLKFVNPMVLELTGRTEEELFSLPFLELVHHDDRELARNNYLKRLKGEAVDPRYPLRILKNDKSIIWIEMSGVKIEWEGHPASLNFVTDITDRKQAEEALQQAHDELEQRVADRTEKLRQANEGLQTEITDRKRAEDALKRSQKMLAETEKIGKVGGWDLNIDTKGQAWTEEIYNIHEVDLTYNPTFENGINFYTPNSLPIIDQALKRAIEYSEPFDLELEIITAKGNLRYVHAIGKPDLDHHRVYGFFQDITARKQAEAKSRSDQQLLKIVIDNSRYLIYAKNLDGKFILASQSLSKFFNQQAPEQLLGKTSHDFLPKEIADQHRTNDLEVIARQSVISFEETAITKDGLHTFLTNKFPLLDSNGKIYAVCGTSVDITERKRMEEALHEAEAKYRSIVDNSVEGIFQTTPDGRFLSVNPALAHILGYDSPDDLMASVTDIGRQLYVSQEEREGYLRLINEKGQVKGFEVRMYRKDGSVIWVAINTRIIRDDAGNPLFYEGFVIDITCRKQIEEDLRKSETNYRQLFDNAPSAIYQIDFRTGKFIKANDVFCEYLGYSQGEITSLSPYDILTDESKKLLSERLNKMILGEKVTENPEYEIIGKNGERRWLQLTSKNIPSFVFKLKALG